MSQIDDTRRGVKREMNPNAREFKPKIADPAYVRKEEIGTGSEIVHSEQDKRDGNHNYSQQKWGSEKSEFPSKQYTNRNRQRNDSRRDNDKSRRSYQNSRSNRRSPDGHYSNIREGNEGSRNHRSRERNDYREKRKDSYGRKSSFVNDEYKNRGQVYSNRQPDDHNWNVKQDDQQSYCRGNENSRDATTYDKPEIPNRNEGYKPYQHTRNYNHRREENLTNQERMENSSGRRNSSSAKVEMKTIEPGSFEPLPSDPNWDVELQQKPSDENWDNKVQQQPIDENWDDEIFSGGHEKNQDATTYGIKPLEDRDQFEGISDSWDRNEGHKVNQGIRNQESGNKDRKSSLERKRQQNNEVVPDLRLVKNEKLGATKKYSLKKQNLADPRMDRENKSKQLKSDGIRENDDDTQREPSTSSEKTDGEDNKGDKDLDSRDDQESIFLYDAWNNQDVKCNRKSLPESKPRKTHDRMSAGGESSDDRIEKFHKDYYDRSYEKIDAEYKEFNIEFKWRADHKYIRVTEKEQDLFGMPKEYSLGHCVAEDMRMGSGIAVSFKRDFKNLDDLLSQRQKQGGLAVLQHEGRYIYYLVTKKVSTGKPTYETFWSSLKKMREHVVENEVKKLAIPRIGCGLDRLEWDKVKYMIEFLFKKVEVEIVVCNFQQNYGQTKQKLQTKSDLPKSKQKMKTPPSSSKSGKTKGKKKK